MGRKTPLLLIPGILCDEGAWRHQVDALSDIAECIVADLKDHETLEAMASSSIEQMACHFAVAGHSMGGRIALEIHRQVPERISCLALIDTGTHPVRDGEAERRQAAINIVSQSGIDAFIAPWLKQILPPSRWDDRDLTKEISEMIKRFTVKDFEQQNNAMLRRPDATPLLKEIECPCLLLCGADDNYSPPEQHREMAKLVSGSKLVILDGCGHMAPMEAPQAVSAELRVWLGTQR